MANIYLSNPQVPIMNVYSAVTLILQFTLSGFNVTYPHDVDDFLWTVDNTRNIYKRDKTTGGLITTIVGANNPAGVSYQGIVKDGNAFYLYGFVPVNNRFVVKLALDGSFIASIPTLSSSSAGQISIDDKYLFHYTSTGLNSTVAKVNKIDLSPVATNTLTGLTVVASIIGTDYLFTSDSSNQRIYRLDKNNLGIVNFAARPDSIVNIGFGQDTNFLYVEAQSNRDRITKSTLANSLSLAGSTNERYCVLENWFNTMFSSGVTQNYAVGGSGSASGGSSRKVIRKYQSQKNSDSSYLI